MGHEKLLPPNSDKIEAFYSKQNNGNTRSIGEIGKIILRIDIDHDKRNC
jgi:hypothetical protein